MLAAACFLALVAYALLPHLLRRGDERSLLATCRRHRLIALTFDDGPGRQLTPLILERLRAAGAQATFFVLGRAIDDHRDLLATMQRDGHEIGSHGEQHVDHLRSWPWRGVADTARGLRRLRHLLGANVAVPFRPPYGNLHLVSLLHACWRGLHVTGWTHDSGDTSLQADIAPAVLAQNVRYSGGGVVLLHDFDRVVPNPEARVLARLDALLELGHEGFRFVRMSDLRAAMRTGTLPSLPTPMSAPALLAIAPPAPPAADSPARPPDRERTRS